MVFSSSKFHLSLLCFFSIIFLAQSKIELLPSDHEALMLIHKELTELTETESLVPKRYVFTDTSNGGHYNNSAVAPSSSQVSSAEASSPMASQVEKHKRNKKKAVNWILKFLAGAFAGSVSGVVIALFLKLFMFLTRRYSKNTNLRIFNPMIKKPKDLAFLGKEDGLEALDVIGRGGCGLVYKAVLPGSNGKEIAIKKVVRPPRDAGESVEEYHKLLSKKLRQIRSEIETVGRVRHRNLLPLLAHFSRPNCHYLVYEYMKNGSLENCIQYARQGKRPLDWLARYKIALGVAMGLEHLHLNHKPRIIHRDLKPANILLDDKMEARITDFGLAESVPDANTHVSTSNVAGTVGYIAPEYYQTFTYTDKCDIYSFGVVLAVLVMGKLPSDDFFQQTDEMTLIDWMRSMMTSEEPRRAIDPKLLGNGYEEQMLLVLKVACFCTLQDPKERPTSKDARCMLSQITH